MNAFSQDRCRNKALRRLAAACAALFAAATPGPTLTQPAPAPAPLAAVPPGANTFERLATGAGITSCSKALRTLGPVLTGPEGGYAVMLMANRVAPAASAFSASIEKSGPAGTTFVSAFFSPGLMGGCDVGYDTVSTWNKSCQDVALQDFRYAQPLNVIGRNISVLPYSPTHHVYLIRMPGGCISINKEMLYP